MLTVWLLDVLPQLPGAPGPEQEAELGGEGRNSHQRSQVILAFIFRKQSSSMNLFALHLTPLDKTALRRKYLKHK